MRLGRGTQAPTAYSLNVLCFQEAGLSQRYAGTTALYVEPVSEYRCGCVALALWSLEDSCSYWFGFGVT